MPIGGPGDIQPQVSAGLAAQPLATSADPSVVGPAAVENLVNSVRNGSITMNDILDRVGTLGQASRKAHIQQLGEYVSPNAIENRRQQLLTGTAQGQLAQQQAQAGQEILPSQTYAAKQQAKLAGFNPADQEAIAAFGTFNQVPKDENGDYNYDKIVSHGYDYKGAFQMWQIANKGLAISQRMEGIDPKTGQKTITLLDGYGNPRTPESVAKYTRMQADAFNEAYDVKARRHEDGPFNATPSSAAPLAPAAPVSASLVSPAAAPATSAQPMVTPSAGGPVTVSTPNHTITVSNNAAPAAAPPVDTRTDYEKATIPVGPVAGTTPDELRKWVDASPAWKNWQDRQPAMSDLDTVKANYARMDAKKESTTVNDIALVSDLMQLQSGNPSGLRAGKEIPQANRFEEAQSFAEQMLGKYNKARGRRIFEPAFRDQLIARADQLRAAHEAPAQNALISAQQANPDTRFTKDEFALMNKTYPQTAIQQGDLQPSAPAPAAGGHAPGAREFPGRGWMKPGPGGGYIPE